MVRTSSFVLAAILALTVPGHAQQSAAADASGAIAVDAHAQGTPFPHFWDQMFGSGRANLVMRANYQRDLRLV
ncbi:MAG TPA: hypothetical protein VJV22_16845, partial [Acidobacteriaceae bacterium]|nr:hypothetical protein [Acidobacteriaceae bacterium]